MRAYNCRRDPANVTHDFPRPEPRGDDVKRGTAERETGERRDGRRKREGEEGGEGGDQENAGSSPG